MMKGTGKSTAYGLKAKKTRDEDLLLFREMFKRETERNSNFLLEVSEDFEPSHPSLRSHSIYKPPTGKKEVGNDFLGTERNKNDYDWLKTPPATPLFPSLEMEANDPNMMIYQRELPIVHNFQPSRFVTKMEEPKFKQRPISPFKMEEPKYNQRPISPFKMEEPKYNQRPISPFKMEEPTFRQRPKSPSSRSSSSSSSRPETPSTRPLSNTTSLGGLLNLPERQIKQSASNSSRRPTGRPTTPKKLGSSSASSTRSTTPNTSTAMTQNIGAKTGSRGVSPAVRPRILATLPGFSDEAPPNLITSVSAVQGRAISATRGRAGSITPGAAEPKAESVNSRMQSRSPIFTRGRKIDTGEKISSRNTTLDSTSGNGVVMGSRMVQKMMNARRLPTAEGKDFQTKNRNPGTERPDLGKLMSRTSVNMALKQMEMSKNPNGGVKNPHIISASSNKTSSQTSGGSTCTGSALSSRPSSHTTVGSTGRFRNRSTGTAAKVVESKIRSHQHA